MQGVEIAEEINLFPFGPIPVEDLKEPGEPVRMGILFTKYSIHSPLQAHFTVYYAEAKIGKDWVYRGICNTWFGKELNLLGLYELITGPAFKTETDTLQSIPDEKEAKRFKNAHFNYACFSGTFHKREDKSLVKHSGLICIDLDNLGSELYWFRETINKDPLTIMSFVSPSGTGLKVIYKINPEKHSQKVYYQYLTDHLSQLCALPKKNIDEACSDVSRACFLPHDPSCYLNLTMI